MSNNDGGTAFPFAPTDHSNANYLAEGMSLRDWFAGQALAGIMAADDHTGEPHHIALVCYGIADAMLAARNSTPTKGD